MWREVSEKEVIGEEVSEEEVPGEESKSTEEALKAKEKAKEEALEELKEMVEIHQASTRCERQNVSEAAWNCEVHSRFLRRVLKGQGKVLRQDNMYV